MDRTTRKLRTLTARGRQVREDLGTPNKGICRKMLGFAGSSVNKRCRRYESVSTAARSLLPCNQHLRLMRYSSQPSVRSVLAVLPGWAEIGARRYLIMEGKRKLRVPSGAKA